jgi:hypothetical protein
MGCNGDEAFANHLRNRIISGIRGDVPKTIRAFVFWRHGRARDQAAISLGGGGVLVKFDSLRLSRDPCRVGSGSHARLKTAASAR